MVWSITIRAARTAFFTFRMPATAPTFMVSPSMIMASSVVSPSSSGDPPYPTDPSHCACSQNVHAGTNGRVGCVEGVRRV